MLKYLRGQPVEVPRQYNYGTASPDCLHCTAYLDENGGKLRYLRDFHSVQAEQEQQARLMKIALGELEPIDGKGGRRLRARKNPPPFILENVLRDLKPRRVYSAEVVSLKFGVSVDAVRPMMLGTIMRRKVKERPARRGFRANYWVPDVGSRTLASRHPLYAPSGESASN
ncbi:hypothetical protein K8353_28770 [Burkholderia contaminans]|nr:hypothetical protein [Burkholderia contaminans]